MSEKYRGEGDRIREALNDVRISERDFVDIYGKRKVEKDLGWLAGVREQFEKAKNKEGGELLEYVVMDQMSEADFFGDFDVENGKDMIDDGSELREISTTVASEVDDVSARTDVIVALNNKMLREQVLSLDVTASSDSGVVAHKFLGSHKNKNLPRGFEDLDYVEVEEGLSRRGRFKRVPHFVVGVDEEEARTLVRLLEQREGRILTEQERDVRDKLIARVGYKVVDEMYEQARYIAEVNGNDRSLGVLRNYLAQARRKAEKRLVAYGGSLEDIGRDNTYGMITTMAVNLREKELRVVA